LMASHRVTKDSVNARSARRQQQLVQLKMQKARMEAEEGISDAKAAAAIAALDAVSDAATPRRKFAALEALLDIHEGKVQELANLADDKKSQSEDWLALAYRVQMKLDKEMDVEQRWTARNAAGILMKPTGALPPVVLGELKLPAQKELSSLVVNPYKVDSWPIEPNSRGGRASGDPTYPPISECDEEDLPPSEPEEESEYTDEEVEVENEVEEEEEYEFEPSTLPPIATNAPTGLPPLMAYKEDHIEASTASNSREASEKTDEDTPEDEKTLVSCKPTLPALAPRRSLPPLVLK